MGPTASIGGFSWARAQKSVTQGILLWSEVFHLRKPNGEDVSEPNLINFSRLFQIAVLLMDTEGAFDDHSTGKQSATIFSIAALVSSLLVRTIPCYLSNSEVFRSAT